MEGRGLATCVGAWGCCSCSSCMAAYPRGPNTNSTQKKNKITRTHAHTPTRPHCFSACIDLVCVQADCFHPSAEGQAVVARGLFENLLQPVGQFEPLRIYRCRCRARARSLSLSLSLSADVIIPLSLPGPKVTISSATTFSSVQVSTTRKACFAARPCAML